MSTKSQLDILLEKGINDFDSEFLRKISYRTIPLKNSKDTKNVPVNKSSIEDALKLIANKKKIEIIKNDLLEHYKELRTYLSLSSSPKSFKTAWDVKSKTLNFYDFNNISNNGGQLIPSNNNVGRLLKHEEQGVLLGLNQRLILGIRHSKGNYNDEIDDMGRLTYFPPRNVRGLVRHRWTQFLSKSLGINMIVLAIVWYELKINDDLNYIYLICPAKVIEIPKIEKIVSNKSLTSPLRLQLITREEAYETIEQLMNLDVIDNEYPIRVPLDSAKVDKWSYNQVKSGPKGTAIKAWAKSVGKKCPDCDAPFSAFLNNKIDFGHIIFQDWCRTYGFSNNIKHHPDNLYLSCSSCNSSLNNNFPYKNLLNKIEETGTIGDWIRNNEKNIEARIT
ncbi:hypothetical protein [Peribacillus frigoritolerans]|uniref:hypothetical protein n=1 Tax=Peribacillus frigoritolerans TaxID=450367 RepID=UPI001F503857|nr:hypothetical protein [Peribacillus frigoritolerans]MCK2017950.1 hypothetical protein [Peribacillus frigoritolerans]